MTRPLTPVMRRTLGAIAAHWHEYGVAPTVRELAAAQGLRSTNGVGETLAKLMERGLLTHQSGRARTIRLTVEGIEEGERTA